MYLSNNSRSVLTTSSSYDDETITGTILDSAGYEQAQIDGDVEEEVCDKHLVVLHVGQRELMGQ